MKKILNFALIAIIGLTMASCRKQEGCTDPTAINFDSEARKDDGSCEYETPYNPPSAYTFDSVDYGGQTVRLLLLKDLSAKIGTATTAKVTTAELNAIYENTAGLYSSVATGKKLEDKVSDQSTRDSIQLWFAQIDSLSGTGGTFVRADGVDLKQMVEKTLMGSVFYFRAINDYLNKLNASDNITKNANGTAMEHHMDEAFGYFGAARDLNSYSDAEIITPGEKDTDGNGSIDPAREKNFYYAQTAAKRDVTASSFGAASQTDFTGAIFTEFVKARYAISQKNYEKRDSSITEIKALWDKLIAATVVSYANKVKAGGADLNKHWAEMKGYAGMIGHNPSNKLGSANLATLMDYIGGNPSEASASDIDALKSLLGSAYGFTTEQLTGF